MTKEKHTLSGKRTTVFTAPPTLKEVVTVRVVVFAHKLNFLPCGTRVATSNLPPSSAGEV